jgi:hypothetical protein
MRKHIHKAFLFHPGTAPPDRNNPATVRHYEERYYFGERHVFIPRDARLIHFGIQDGARAIWYETSGGEPEIRRLFVAGTGDRTHREDGGYKGTPDLGEWVHFRSFFEPGPRGDEYVYVWHLYQRKEDR